MYEVISAKKYVKTNSNIEVIKESNSIDFLLYETDFLNGEFQNYDDYWLITLILIIFIDINLIKIQSTKIITRKPKKESLINKNKQDKFISKILENIDKVNANEWERYANLDSIYSSNLFNNIKIQKIQCYRFISWHYL